MAPSITFRSSLPAGPGPRVPGPSHFVRSEEIIQQSDADDILANLRQTITAGTEGMETILGSIAEAARSLSGAAGAAIAMPRGDAVVCVGRSGEAAPQLGARVNVDSGISGECLRTGTILRCDDVSRDLRVDTEVCRHLGLQSIAAVPLRGQQGRVGVLEAFSSRTYAFDDDDMGILGRLAGLAERAWAQGSNTEVPTDTEPTDTRPSRSGVGENASSIFAYIPALARLARVLSGGPHDKVETLHYAMIGVPVVVVLVLSSALGWRVWYNASIVSKSIQHPSPHAAAAGPPTVSSEVEHARRSGREFHISPPHAASALHALKSTAGRQTTGSMIQRPNRSDSNSDSNRDASASTPSVDDVQFAVVSAKSTNLESALLTTPVIPSLGASISQKVQGGVLQHKVLPVYPSEARRMGVEGKVELEATVTERGQVEDLKVISGNPLLAQAVMDAVRKWRYSPVLLNGKPTRRETIITVSFRSAAID
jgi:TonB family protein